MEHLKFKTTTTTTTTITTTTTTTNNNNNNNNNTAIEFSLGGSSHTSTEKTNKNKYT
jgi:hypothetical protein